MSDTGRAGRTDGTGRAGGTGGTGVLRARGLRKEYGQAAGLVRAVDEVDLDVAAGETLAVMGRAAAGSRRCCTCSAAWTGPRAASCG